MSCNRCTDIHQAQKEGKTQLSCQCGCHTQNIGFGASTTALSIYDLTSAGTQLTNSTSTTGTWDFTTNQFACGFSDPTEDAFNNIIRNAAQFILPNGKIINAWSD